MGSITALPYTKEHSLTHNEPLTSRAFRNTGVFSRPWVSFKLRTGPIAGLTGAAAAAVEVKPVTGEVFLSNPDMQEKEQIRERMRALRHSLSPQEVRSAGAAVAQGVMERPEAISATTVCLYAHTGKEIPTDGLIMQFIDSGKKVVVPDWEGWKQGSGLRAAAIETLDDLDSDSRVVPQPSRVEGNIVPAEEIDLFLLPGLAFDPQGNRLGMGGGYFDRFLAHASSTATFLGLAYDFQVIAHLPAEDHDIRIHDVVTPGRASVRGFNDKREGMEYGT